MKNKISLFILIPNFPFITILAIYTIIMIRVNSPNADLEMMENNLITKEIEDWAATIYPKELRLLIAFLFYSTLLIHFI